MELLTMNDFEYLGTSFWDQPEQTGRRIKHLPVHVYRHRRTGQLHVILFEDQNARLAPTYIVPENDLYGGITPA
jgi:hypothetical protein